MEEYAPGFKDLILERHVNTPLEVGVPFVVGAISVVVQPIGVGAVSAVGMPSGHASGPSQAQGARVPLRDEVAALEKSRIVEALAACGGNQTKAAAMLGIPRRTLVLRLAEYDRVLAAYLQKSEPPEV